MKKMKSNGKKVRNLVLCMYLDMVTQKDISLLYTCVRHEVEPYLPIVITNYFFKRGIMVDRDVRSE